MRALNAMLVPLLLLLGAGPVAAATSYEAGNALTFAPGSSTAPIRATIERAPFSGGADTLGSFPTFALADGSATDFDGTPRPVGQGFTLGARVQGSTTGDPFVAQLARSFAEVTGKLTLTNVSALPGTMSFDIAADFAFSTLFDNPAIETIFAKWGFTFGGLVPEDSINLSGFPDPLGMVMATNQNVPLSTGTFTGLGASFLVSPGQAREITITLRAEGEGTQAVAAIPLPAAAPLMLSGLAGLGLLLRRRSA
ncbi:MAG: hypothetical protein ACK515_27360 [bacterium]